MNVELRRIRLTLGYKNFVDRQKVSKKVSCLLMKQVTILDCPEDGNFSNMYICL